MMSWSLFGLFSLPLGIIADHIGLEETFILMGLFCIGSIIAIDLIGRVTGIRSQPTLASARREQPAGG